MEVTPVTLEGGRVRLEPLSLDHLDGLAAVGLHESIWRWSPVPVTNRDEMKDYIETALRLQQTGDALPFATIDKTSNKPAGSTRFGEVAVDNRRVEIGWTWLGPQWQRTVMNTEAKYLMLTHAFDTWGCARVELKTDAMNDQSRSAILRIGAKEEGILRKHMLTSSGRFRDTVYYSILDDEWPDVRKWFLEKLKR